MRPLKLKIEGYTCFKERQEPLNLEDLDLFVISGATGSGKSSLLDAMIFALLGRVPRMGKQGLSELISLGSDRMAVILDFRLGETDYRVARAAHRSRATRAMLEEINGQLTRPIAEGVKNVDEEVHQLLGFDYDTFTRAVILPQGEFAAFLKSRPGEQQKILRDLLRLHVYEEMRHLAHDQQKTLKARIEGDERRIAEDFSEATPGELEMRRKEAARQEKRLAAREKELAEKRSQVEKSRRDLARLRELLEPKEKAERRAEELTAKHAGQEEELGRIGERRKEIEVRRKALGGKLSETRGAAAAIGYDPGLDARLDKLRDSASRLADRRQTLHHQSARAQELTGEVGKAESRAAKQSEAEAEVRRLLAVAGEQRREKEAALREAEHRNHVALLRRDLEPGEACPVCEQAVETPPEVPDLPELEALAEEVASAREVEEKARLGLETARKVAADARAEVEALRRQAEDADQRAKQLAVEVGREAGELQAEIGGRAREDSGEHIEERVLAAARRVRRERAEHAAAGERINALEKEATEADRQCERLADETESLKKRQNELAREIAAARKEAESYSRRIREIGRVEGLEELEKELAAIQARESEERQLLGALTASLADLERRVARRSELEAGLGDLRASHRCHHQLSQDLRSDRFEAYLLEKTFRELVQGASVRLMELSQRYTLDFEAGGFRVLDHDNASQPRSTDTLSGGETFLASLSLALELSEQIQREAGAVSLDSIFIDEGFGTLDPETLEMVTEAIESLPTGGRMVGIITHIPELTRRLPYRVLVDKRSAGSRYRVEEG